MAYRTYHGLPDEAGAEAALTNDFGDVELRGRKFIADSTVEHAVNVAIALQRPLLVTGEPGVGKTVLGFSIARRVPGADRVHYFACKSTSEARDLLYNYDALSRFHAGQIHAASRRDPVEAAVEASTSVPAAPPKASDFITYVGLGRAILEAHDPKRVTRFGNRSWQPSVERRSVVIIDEIDKASRDFMNDLLDELDRMRFVVRELALEAGTAMGQSGEAATPPRDAIKPDHMPIVIITSNQEAPLPEPFIRRCAYCNLEFPTTADELSDIIVGQVQKDATQLPWIRQAAQLLLDLRGRSRDRQPGTAELIDFVQGVLAQDPMLPIPELFDNASAAIAKSANTRKAFKDLLAALDTGGPKA